MMPKTDSSILFKSSHPHLFTDIQFLTLDIVQDDLYSHQLFFSAQLLRSSLYLSSQHTTNLHFPWPLYWVSAVMSRLTSPLYPSLTHSTRDSMARTRAWVSSLLRVWLLIHNNSHFTLPRMLTRSQLLTLLLIARLYSTQEASEARCSVGTEAKFIFRRSMDLTEFSIPW